MNRRYYSYRENGSPILPVGWVNPKKGECEYFNIYETWNNSTVEVYKDRSGKLRYVVTSGAGDKDLKPTDRKEFCHDQTRKGYGSWEFVTMMPLEDLKTSGLKSAFMYCYK